ncbi:SDR family oxidoreductase [Streptomyces sp. NPDC005474]|uniref:SDR family oxidoreductase n=1 Tax=Streptomyces sp. NPDC005474 TaxID=3154878 RepID=UPI0034546E16
MELKGSVALVTGANRGLGRHLAQQLVNSGAKVYAAARHPETVDLEGVTPLRLDVTDEESVREAARIASDVTLLVNNAGVARANPLIGGSMEHLHAEMDTNFFGPLAMTRTFAPILEGNGGGAVLNIVSVIAWMHAVHAGSSTAALAGSYAASKAATWAMSNAAREELAPRGISVSALYVGLMDTDMTAVLPPEGKVDPADVAAQALRAIEQDAPEILADEYTQLVKQGLSGTLAAQA